MILNNSSSTVTTVGDVAEHQVSIDKNNLEHIISILSTNLYSQPEQSFLREIICNAIDSQVEAGSLEPAIISIDNNGCTEKYTISIRDYGTGISPERFKEIFLNIGSSTKRESNDYIGSFGIGRFSALACADMVHILSYYNGIQYHYLMLKNGTKINIDLISESATTEPNGVEIKIEVEDIKPYCEALQYLWFIPNVYVHNNLLDSERYLYRRTGEYYPVDHTIEAFNKRVLYQFKNFSYNNLPNRYGNSCAPKVLLGNILYPIKSEYIPLPYNGNDNFNYIWKYIIPHFDIGEIDITPNREQLLYSDRTKAALEKRYREVADELTEMCKKESEKVFNNIYKYYDASVSSYKEFALSHPKKVVEDDLTLTLTTRTFLYDKITYKYKEDNPYIKDEMVKHALSRQRYLSPDAIFDNVLLFSCGKFWTKKTIDRTCYNALLHKYSDIRLFFVPSLNNLHGNIFKEYLASKEKAFTDLGKKVLFVITSTPPTWRRIIHAQGIGVAQKSNYNLIDWKKSLWFLKQIIDSFKDWGGVYTVCDIINTPDYIDFKNKVSAERKRLRKESSNTFNNTIRFYYYMRGNNRYNYYPPSPYKIDVRSIQELVSTMGSEARSNFDTNKCPIYWGVQDDPYINIWEALIHNKQQFIVVKVAKTNIKYLEKAQLPSNWQRITPQFILNSRVFCKWVTKKNNYVACEDNVLDIIKYSKDYNSLKAVISAVDWSTYASILESDTAKKLEEAYEGPYDASLLEGYELIKKYNAISRDMSGAIYLANNQVNLLSVYVSMKRGLFRPNWSAYKQIIKTLNPKEEETINYEENY